MPYKKLRNLKKNERGAALLEFAIAIPILLALIIGIMEFAWILNGNILISGAAREGARLAIVSEHTDISDDEIKKVIINHARTFTIDKNKISIEPANGSIKVTIQEATLPLLTGFIPVLGSEYIMYDIEATMMLE